MTAQSTQTAQTEATAPQHGAEVIVPLNRLKASPRNARKTPHSPATIEAFAASIKAKGVLQPPVVEVERDGEGVPTGNYFVTIGEGRRQGLRLLAKRKAIKRTHPVRCIVDAENDAHEISLDENMTREAMHPADQFEAFQRLATEKGYGPEEIGARFGVSAHVVRQRLRLPDAHQPQSKDPDFWDVWTQKSPRDLNWQDVIAEWMPAHPGAEPPIADGGDGPAEPDAPDPLLNILGD